MTKDQNAPSPIPNIFATYKKDNWGAFGCFTVSGGGGTVDYKDGNATTYGLGANFASKLKAAVAAKAGAPESAVTVAFEDDNAQAVSVYYTFAAGGSYQVNEQVSVAAGARYIYADKSIDASCDFTPDVAGNKQDVQHMSLKYDETAQGVGGVASVNYVPIKPLRLALRYESKVDLKFKLKDKSNELGKQVLASSGKEDDGKYRRDLPALLGFGANYKLDDKWSFATAFTYYFEKDANWEGVEQKVSSNSHDLAFSTRYNFTEKIWGTLGYLRTENYLPASDFTLAEQMSPPLDCNTYTVGAGYLINKNMSVNLSFMSCIYEDDSAGEGASKVTYGKRNDILAFGFEYSM